MSRVYKKIFSLFGLALVAAITVIAYGIPPSQQDGVSAISQSSNVMVAVEITSSSGAAIIDKPDFGTTLLAGNTNTATITYANATSLTAYITLPSGNTLPGIPLSLGTDPIQLNLNPYLSEYGTYTLEINGTSASGSYIDGDSTTFSFHAIATTPTEDDQNHPVGGTIHVQLGPIVCQLNIKVFPKGNTTGDPLLTHFIEDVSVCEGYVEHPEYLDIKIPNFEKLDADKEYEVVVTAMDCSGNPLEDSNFILSGITPEVPPTPPGPPNTGATSMFNLDLSRSDLLLTSLLVFLATAIFGIILINRNQKASVKIHRRR